MIVLIAGATHTGKTNLAQKLLEKYKYPYLSIDHLKMGLIRSGNTDLTVYDDDKLTPYLWNIVKEMVKTAIENNQNLIIVMTEQYIENHFSDIKKFENIIERRKTDDLTKESIIKENTYNLEMCRKHGCNYILIDDVYEVEL